MDPSQLITTIISIMNTALINTPQMYQTRVIEETIKALEQINTPGRVSIVNYLKSIYLF
jgi:hypothetical protein